MRECGGFYFLMVSSLGVLSASTLFEFLNWHSCNRFLIVYPKESLELN